MSEEINSWSLGNSKLKVTPKPTLGRFVSQLNSKELQSADLKSSMLDLSRSLDTISIWLNEPARARTFLYDAARILVQYYQFEPYTGPLYRTVFLTDGQTESVKTFPKDRVYTASVAREISSWTTSLDNALNFAYVSSKESGFIPYMVVKFQDSGLQIFNTKWGLSVANHLVKTLEESQRKTTESYPLLKKLNGLIRDSHHLAEDLLNYLTEDEVILLLKKPKIKVQLVHFQDSR